MFKTRQVVNLGKILGASLSVGALLAACTGDKGDTGPAGPAGPTGPSGTSGPGQDPAGSFATATPIKHVVVIFGENVSFDHYFGTYPQVPVLSATTHAIVDPNSCQPAVAKLTAPDGVPFIAAPNTPKANNLLTPLDVTNKFAALSTTGQPLLCTNPNLTNTANDSQTAPRGPVTVVSAAANPFRMGFLQATTQDQGHNYGPEQAASHNGAMDLFPFFTGAPNPATQAPAITNASLVMGYFDGNTVTALWNYAQNFAMSDNSWTTQFGPSTPGAINLISGQTNGMIMSNQAGGSFAGFSPNHVLADGQGGFTLIGDTDPLNDVCSTSGEQNLMAGQNIGDLLNAKNISWGSFMGGFDLGVTNPNGTSGCGRLTLPTQEVAVGGPSTDYIPHHAWFQYYASTANPTHARPSSLFAIGSSKTVDGKAAEPANHNYDTHDFFEAMAAGNLPAVSFLKAPAFQDGHAGYSNPIDEQAFVVSTINAIQRSPFWASTAIIIAYDDSDGWYDHQAPPILNPSSPAAIGVTTAADAIDQLNGAGLCTDGGATSHQGTVLTTPLNGAQVAKPVLGRCGYGTRIPLMVISPFAKKNFIDHTLTDQSSVLKFIEDNWLGGQRIAAGASFDTIAGPINGMFTFPASQSAAAEMQSHPRQLILHPETGTLVDE